MEEEEEEAFEVKVEANAKEYNISADLKDKRRGLWLIVIHFGQ